MARIDCDQFQKKKKLIFTGKKRLFKFENCKMEN